PRAEVRGRTVSRHQQTDHDAEPQALDGAAAALVAHGVDPRRAAHAGKNSEEHQREPARVAGWTENRRISSELAGEQMSPDRHAICGVQDGRSESSGNETTVIHGALLSAEREVPMLRALFIECERKPAARRPA